MVLSLSDKRKPTFTGPHPILQVHTNGTITINLHDNLMECIYIILPFIYIISMFWCYLASLVNYMRMGPNQRSLKFLTIKLSSKYFNIWPSKEQENSIHVNIVEKGRSDKPTYQKSHKISKQQTQETDFS